MSHAFHKLWLKVIALLVASVAPLLFLGTMEATSEPARLVLDFLNWPIDGQSSYSAPETRFLSALTAGFLIGWGVMIWYLAVAVYDHAPDAVRRAVIFGLVCWFLTDSTGSILSGHSMNVVFNVIFFLIGVGPILASARDETPASSGTR